VCLCKHVGGGMYFILYIAKFSDVFLFMLLMRFVVCSEDGTVRQFDLRLPRPASPPPRGLLNDNCENVLLDMRKQNGGLYVLWVLFMSCVCVCV